MIPTEQDYFAATSVLITGVITDGHFGNGADCFNQVFLMTPGNVGHYNGRTSKRAAYVLDYILSGNGNNGLAWGEEIRQERYDVKAKIYGWKPK